jgi:hypothetical protein
MPGNIVGQWLFENNLNDSSGLGQSLTGNGSPTYDSVNYKEGSYSLNLVRASSQCAYIADASLDASFPLKNGTSNPSFSVGMWVRPTALSAATAYMMFQKGAVFYAQLYGPSNLQITLGQTNVVSVNPGVVLDTWHFIGLSLDSVSGDFIVYIWNPTSGITYEAVHTLLHTTDPDNTRFTIGGNSTNGVSFQGQIDSFTMYDGALNRDELEALKDQTSPVANLSVSQVHAQIEYTPATTNDFTNDGSCVADWKFNSGALTTDSKSTNTLTNNNTVAEDTTNQKEGNACATFDGADYFSIADADLAAGFPTKSGDTAKLFTITGFFKTPSSLPGSTTWQTLISKRKTSATAAYSWWLGLNNSRLKFLWYYSGATTYTYDVYASNLATSTRYFFMVVVDGVNKTFNGYLWNADTGAYIGTATQSPANVLQVPASSPALGIGGDGDGNTLAASGTLIDNISIFNRKISQTDGSYIFQLGYAPVIGADRQEVGSVLAQVEYEETPQIRVESVLAQIEYDQAACPTLDVSADTGCKAKYSFENGVLTTDSIGSNTLTNHDVNSDISYYKELAASAYLNGAAYLNIADADLGAGFPFKNGDTTKKMSFSFLVNFRTVAAFKGIITKWGATGHQSFGFKLGSFNRFQCTICYTDGTNETHDTSFTPTAGVWYSVVFTVDGIAKKAYVSIKNIVTNVDVGAYSNFTLAKEMAACDADLCIGIHSGSTDYLNAWLDELIIWNRCLNDYEVEAVHSRSFKIRANNFSGLTSLKAYWKFNSADPLADSSGNNNTITDNGSQSWGWPYQAEGDAARFQSGYGGTFSWYIPNASLCAGFPLKSDDTSKKLTICGFITPLNASSSYSGVILGKGDTYNANTTFSLYLGDSRQLQVKWGDGSSQVNYDTGIYLVMNRYYHFGLVIDGIAKTIYLRVFEPFMGSVYTYSATPSNELALNSGAWRAGISTNIGCCCLDELLFFNECLDATTIDAIRNGIFIPPANAVSATICEATTLPPSPPANAVSATICEAAPVADYPPANAISETTMGTAPVVPPENVVSQTTMGTAPIVPPDSAISLTTCEGAKYPPDTCYSLSIMGTAPVVPPENTVSATISETPKYPPWAAVSQTTMGTPPVIPPENTISLTTMGTAPIVPPDSAISLTTCEETKYPPDTCYSHTTCGSAPWPPANSVSETICADTQVVPVDSCISNTTMGAPLPEPPANCVSETIMEAIVIYPPDACVSLTTSAPSGYDAPDAIISETLCPSMRLAYGEGLFNIF